MLVEIEEDEPEAGVVWRYTVSPLLTFLYAMTYVLRWPASLPDTDEEAGFAFIRGGVSYRDEIQPKNSDREKRPVQ